MIRKPLYLFVMVSFFLIAGNCQRQQITGIEYTTLTRGYYKELLISADSVRIKEKGRGDTNSVIRWSLRKEQWEQVLGALKDVELSSVNDLQSPTSNRAFDGALHSTIRIIAGDSVYTHSFDDENPHKVLQPLMRLILLTEEKR